MIRYILEKQFGEDHKNIRYAESEIMSSHES